LLIVTSYKFNQKYLETLLTIYTYVYLTEKGFCQLMKSKYPHEELFNSAKGLIFNIRSNALQTLWREAVFFFFCLQHKIKPFLSTLS